MVLGGGGHFMPPPSRRCDSQTPPPVRVLKILFLNEPKAIWVTECIKLVHAMSEYKFLVYGRFEKPHAN